MVGWRGGYFVTENPQILAIHAALLPTRPDVDVGWQRTKCRAKHERDSQNLDNSRLFNPEKGRFEAISSANTDIFCATLANGKVLAVAGHPFNTDSRHNNGTPGRYSPETDTRALLTAGSPRIAGLKLH